MSEIHIWKRFVEKWYFEKIQLHMEYRKVKGVHLTGQWLSLSLSYLCSPAAEFGKHCSNSEHYNIKPDFSNVYSLVILKCEHTDFKRKSFIGLFQLWGLLRFKTPLWGCSFSYTANKCRHKRGEVKTFCGRIVKLFHQYLTYYLIHETNILYVYGNLTFSSTEERSPWTSVLVFSSRIQQIVVHLSTT